MTGSTVWLPGPVAGCAGTDGEAWFSIDPGEVALCLRICAGCELRSACLTGALARDEQYGIWGGQLFTRRWVSGSVRPNGEAGGWFLVGRDSHGLLVFAWAGTEDEAELRLTARLEEGWRRGQLVAQARAAARRRGQSLPRPRGGRVPAGGLGAAA